MSADIRLLMEEIFIILGLILLNGVFALAEISLISARKSSLITDAEAGSKSAQTALNLANEPDRFLSTVQIGITLIGILTGIYSGNKIAILFSAWLNSVGIESAIASLLAQTLIVIIVTYLTLVFGELLPKRIGMTVAEPVSKVLAVPMYWLSRICYPFVWLLSKSTSGLFRLFGLEGRETKVTEEEIKSIVNEAAEDGEVNPVEQDIVERVFMVGDLKIDSIMTHRSELLWLDVNMTAEEVRNVMTEDLHTVYPVADGDLDHVKGVVTLKKLFLSLSNDDFNLVDIIEKPEYFYENSNVYKVLETMKADHINSGLICDEFGSCIGIITIRDILESIVGANSDDDVADPWVVERKDGEGWFVDGLCPMYDFLDYFDAVEQLEDKDYNTVAGLCFFQLDHTPECGDTFEWNAFSFEIVDMDGIRIDKLLVKMRMEDDQAAS